jgi:hypothetical protein
MNVKDLSHELNADPFILAQELKKKGYKVISPRSELSVSDVDDIKLFYQHGFFQREDRPSQNLTISQLTSVKESTNIQEQAVTPSNKNTTDIIDDLYKLSTPFPDVAQQLINTAKKLIESKKNK